MGLRRTATALVTALLLAAVTGSCAAVAQPSPVPTVSVHILSRISNVVVSQTGSLIPRAGASPNEGQSLLAPCGGAIDLRAPIVTAGGMLALLMDNTGELDRDYETGNLDMGNDGPTYQLSIMWSSGELPAESWLTITPTEVVQSAAPPAATASPQPCKPWAYGPS